MAKKSRKTAAKYSELSRARSKKKPRESNFSETDMVSRPQSQEMPESKLVASPVLKSKPRTQPNPKRSVAGYQHVRSDLRRTGILAGAMIVIIIVLAFVLG